MTTLNDPRVKLLFKIMRCLGTAAGIALILIGGPLQVLLGVFLLARFLWHIYSYMEESLTPPEQLATLAPALIDTWNFLQEIDPHTLYNEGDYYDLVETVGDALTKAGLFKDDVGEQ